MSFKIGNDTVYIANEKSGVFANVYYQNTVYNMVLTNGLISGADAWFDPSGNAKFSQVEGVNAFQYTQAMGFNTGYISGGRGPGGLFGTRQTAIESFPFASTPTATTGIGNLSIARDGSAGQSSFVSGYTSGGRTPVEGYVFTITKFPFALPFTTASFVGNLIDARDTVAGSSSTEHGYSSGGYINIAPAGAFLSTIDKFAFASDGNASLVGYLNQSRAASAGQSSSTYGYNSGGATRYFPSNLFTAIINKFPFASDAGGTTVGSLTAARASVAGVSSATHGYSLGGTNSPTTSSSTIDRFPFSVDSSATFVGSLSSVRSGAIGQSSVTHGYSVGDGTSIDRFPFASASTPASNVGNLPLTRSYAAGHQY